MSVASLLGENPQSQLLRVAPTVLAVLAGTWLAWSAVQVLWSFFPEPEVVIDVPLATRAPQVSVATGAAASLASYHLFGQTASGDLPNAPDAPETQLKLTLIGTAAGRDPKSGVAIIVDEEGRQRAYQVGEIVGQATVDSIYRDRVVLMFQGRLETLLRPKTSTADTLRSTSAPGSGAYVDQPGSVNVNAIGVGPDGYVSPTAGVTVASFDAVRAEVMANPAAVMGMLSPVFDGSGNLQGVKISSGSHDPLLQKAGILPSDVIVSVNGQRIDSISKGTEIANNLASANEAVIIVRREGREITLPAVRFR